MSKKYYRIEDLKEHDDKLIFYDNEYDKTYYSIKDEYKCNKIDNVNEILPIFKEVYEIVINIYNNLNKDQYLLTRKCLKCVYEKIRTLIIKYNGF